MYTHITRLYPYKMPTVSVVKLLNHIEIQVSLMAILFTDFLSSQIGKSCCY